jgi:SAM-dependent methyltransferase
MKALLQAHPNSHFETLREAAELMSAGKDEQARRVLRSFPELRPARVGGDLLPLLFLQALGTRLNEPVTGEGNLYLREFATSQIDLFGLLGRAMPMVTRASEAANELLSCLSGMADELTLVDIGIGKGRQMAQLLQSLAQSGRAPRSTRIVGIEPSLESLGHARVELESLAAKLKLKLEFHGFAASAEDLSVNDWRRISSLSDHLVVNAAFALHHVRSDRKDAVMAEIAALRPLGFVLSEPHSDHETSDLVKRFEQAWNHYGLVFGVIDAQAVDSTVKNAMKVQFFAREIIDVVGTADNVRTERHETADMWLARLRKAGLAPFQEVCSLGDAAFDGISRRWSGEHISFEFEDQPVVSLMASHS